MAAFLVRPSVISFLDVMTRAGDVTLDLEEVVIKANASIAGKKLSEAKIPERTGLIIMALKKKEENRITSYNVCYTKLLRMSISEV